jgi:nitrous oxidase accessory protein
MYEATTERTHSTAPTAPRAAAWLQRLEGDRFIAALVAAALLALALGMPIWRMTLLAPQYPGGLHMTAYGDRFEGDVREINILNHYIGMKPIDQDEVLELRLFKPAMVALIAVVLVLGVVRLPHWLKVAESLLIWLLPLGLVLDLQWWLYRYGHSLDPHAPLRLPSFTPRVIGTTRVMNFHNEATLAAGFWLLVAAAAVISLGPSLLRALWELLRSLRPVAGAALVLALVLGGTRDAHAQAAPVRLADLIAAAEPGAVVQVPPGIYHEQVTIEKPLTLYGHGAVIDGGGRGDVVTVKADDVEIRGFTIRHSGDAISQEPAGVRLLGHHTILADNRVEDVYFGVMVQGGGHHQIEFNIIRPNPHVAVEWRGHAISLWNTQSNIIRQNDISYAKDGIYISFSNHNFVHGNTIRHSRFGIHYMYADDNRFTDNTIELNLSGALIMYSRRVFLKGNKLSDSHGNTAIGLLLKNVDDLWAEENHITGNGSGIMMEEAPASIGSTVVFHRNLVALNGTGIALMTTTAATFYENSFVDNTVQVSGRSSGLTAALADHGGGTTPSAALPAQVPTPGTRGDHAGHGASQPLPPTPSPPAAGGSARNRWSAEGRGNFWSDYAGYDANGDGIGDRPYRAWSVFGALRDRQPALDLFRFTPAQQALDAAGRLFPLVRPEALIEDPAPLMAPPTAMPTTGDGQSLLAASTVLLALAGGTLWLLRPRRRARARRPVAVVS